MHQGYRRFSVLRIGDRRDRLLAPSHLLFFASESHPPPSVVSGALSFLEVVSYLPIALSQRLFGQVHDVIGNFPIHQLDDQVQCGAGGENIGLSIGICGTEGHAGELAPLRVDGEIPVM